MAIAGLLTLGFSLRLWHYAVQRSLWIDEARLALNVGRRSYATLLQPLDYDQAAPPLFLWATKLLVGLLGMNELTLRLIPLLAGLALLGLMVSVARRLLTSREMIVALAIVAVFPVFVYFSSEFKPYSLDAAGGVGLSLLALRYTERPSPLRALALGAAGMVAPWVTAGSMFVLVGIAAVLLASRILPGGLRPKSGPLVLLAWAASLGMAHFTFYRYSAGNPYLHQFWAYRMLSPDQPDLILRVWVALNEIVTGSIYGASRQTELSPLSIGLTVLMLLLLGVGAIRLLRSRGPVPAGIALTPFLAVLMAAALEQYPLGRRLLLFAIPFLVVSVIAGMGAVVRGAPKVLRPVVVAAFAFLLLRQTFAAAIAAIVPEQLQYTRPIIAELERRAQPEDAVYVDAGSLPGWIYYTTRWQAPDTTRLALAARLGSSGGPAFENAPPRGRGVDQAGDSLIYRAAGRREVYGLFSGMQQRWGLGLIQTVPDAGWATNEARRVMDLPERTVWLTFLYDMGSSPFLRAALAEAGATETFTFRLGFMQLVRVTKPRGLALPSSTEARGTTAS